MSSKNINYSFLKIDFVLANSADPDEMPHYSKIHLVLHCLPKYTFWREREREREKERKTDTRQTNRQADMEKIRDGEEGEVEIIYCRFGNFRENFIFANNIKRHMSDVKNSRLRQDLPTSLNERVILPFREGFIFTQLRI